MMKLKCLGSGSSGNCYLLECNNEILILDCGINIKDIKVGLNFDLSKIVGCVVSHAHHDHDKSANELKNMGIKVWQPYFELDNQKRQVNYIGSFKVVSFDVPHDSESCVGYTIICPNGDRLIYATDFEYIKYSFNAMKINHLLIEANYQKEYVEDTADNRVHVLRGHAELQTTIGIVRDNVDSLKTVILCHLSRNNANPIEMVDEVKKVVKPSVCVDYARRGLEVELRMDECPF